MNTNIMIDNRKPNNHFKAISVWICASVFYLYEMILRNSTNVIAYSLMDTFDLGATALGSLVAFYYHAYTPLQIPCGVLVDRLGPRLIITFSSILCCIGSYLFAQCDTILICKIGRFLMGAGSACAYISCLKLAVSWFDLKYFSLFAGLTNMLGTIGGVLGTTPLAYLVEQKGWRQSMMILCYIGIFVTILCYIAIQDFPKGKTDIHSYRSSKSIRDDFKKISKDPIIWIVGLVGGIMYLPVSAFCELWGTPFLIKTFDIATHKAAIGPLCIYWGMAIGGPFLALMVNRCFKSCLINTMRFSAFSTAIAFVFIAFAQFFSFTMVLIFLLLAGFLIGGQVLCFSIVKQRTDERISATAMAFTNSLVMLCGNIFQPLLGRVLDFQWDGRIGTDGVPIYSSNDYRYSILFIPISLFISFFVLSLVKKNQKKIDSLTS
jgi:sugar phosphate permease